MEAVAVHDVACVGVLESIQAQQLLAALAGFVQHVVHVHAKAAHITPRIPCNGAQTNYISKFTQSARRKVDQDLHNDSDTKTSSEPGADQDSTLLVAFHKFILASISQNQTISNVAEESPRFLETKECEPSGHIPQNNHMPISVNVVHSTVEMMQMSHVDRISNELQIFMRGSRMFPIMHPQLKQLFLTCVDFNAKDGFILAKNDFHSHVFNEMPIRLLAFDSAGSNVRLIDRNEVYQHVCDFDIDQLKQFCSTLPHQDQSPRADMLLQYRARYAVLSHTWIRDTPGDVVYGNWENKDLNPRGYAKISKFCEVAAKRHGVRLAWMDTVCINKDSSSELDESIRSMYKWYQNADVCVAYLSDTEHFDDMGQDSWFTRGWTLQELLAPASIEFYNKYWENISDTDDTLSELPFTVLTEEDITEAIQDRTTITEAELKLFRGGQNKSIPISRKFQLAARRWVTRAEDKVYSLMGLLGVEISIAYGEGEKRAFYRLVRELLNTQRNILDIFNYGMNSSGSLIPSTLDDYKYRLSCFDNTGNKQASFLDRWPPLEPILATHLGVRTPLLLIPGLRRVEDLGSDATPFGDFWGSTYITCLGESRRHFDLLCSRIYTDSAVTTRAHNNMSHNNSPFIAMFGILNFGSDDDSILLPDNCLSIALNCGVKSIGTVGPADAISLIQILHKPAIFQLKSTSHKDRVPKYQLARHGMQLVTLYL